MSTPNPAGTPLPQRAAATPSPQWLPLTILGSLIVAYAALSHYSSTQPDAKGLGAGLSMGPVLLIGVVLVWRWTSPPVGLAAAAAMGALLWRYWPAFERNYEWVDLAQQCSAPHA